MANDLMFMAGFTDRLCTAGSSLGPQDPRAPQEVCGTHAVGMIAGI